MGKDGAARHLLRRAIEAMLLITKQEKANKKSGKMLRKKELEVNELSLFGYRIASALLRFLLLFFLSIQNRGVQRCAVCLLLEIALSTFS